MDPDTGIETRTKADRPRRASRAPWDPPLRPNKPSAIRRRVSEGPLQQAEALSAFDDDLARGAD